MAGVDRLAQFSRRFRGGIECERAAGGFADGVVGVGEELDFGGDGFGFADAFEAFEEPDFCGRRELGREFCGEDFAEDGALFFSVRAADREFQFVEPILRFSAGCFFGHAELWRESVDQAGDGSREISSVNFLFHRGFDDRRGGFGEFEIFGAGVENQKCERNDCCYCAGFNEL